MLSINTCGIITGYVPTSYIPTTSEITTRQTDLGFIDNMLDWFNEREGT